jgi:tetratricopeptide (TPR) repeat protein
MRWAQALPVAALALTAAALFVSDGSNDDRLFWIGAGVVLAASAAGVAILLGRLPLPALSPPGVAFFALLAALAVWQAISIEWSILPSRSWDYANRGFVYVAFACLGAALAGVARRWVASALAALLGALFAVALTAKVFPSIYDDYGRVARLRWPVAYWNELALLAAAAVPLALWLAGRERDKRVRVAGVLLLYGAVVTVVLTYSRTGIVLAVLAGVAWMALDRERLEGLEALAIGALGGGIVAAIGLALPGIRADGQSGSVRAHDGRLFGLAVVLGAVAVAAAAWFLLGRELAVEQRRLVIRVAVAAIAVVVAAGAVGAVVQAGGPIDFVRARWGDFAYTQSSPEPGRLVGTSSGNRWGWWQQAWDAWTVHPAGGTGAGSFRLTSTVRAQNPALVTTEPHNVPLQFLSETGVVGFLLYLGMVVAAVVALRRRGRPDRATTALTLVLALGALHQVVDIDWDFVATQGPLFALAGYLVAAPGRLLARRQPIPAAAVALGCLAALYSLFSPWASDRQLNTGYDRAVTGDFAGALRAAKDAHALNPLAVEPLWLWATMANSDAEARRLYLRAAHREPQNPETWYELGYFEGEVVGDWRAAYRHLDRSWHLDPFGPAGRPPGSKELDKARCKVDPATCR